MRSNLDASCLALWLVDLDLLDVRVHGARREEDRLLIRLEALDFRDEATAREAVSRFLEQKPDLLTVLDRLCGILFTFSRGVAVLGAEASLAMGRRLIRIVDPDTLAALCKDLELAREDGFDWPAVPMDDSGAIASLLRQGSVETHIHLGGALPACFYWLLFVGGAVSPESAGDLVAAQRGHAPGQDWVKAVRRATWLRFALAADAERFAHHWGEGRVFPHLPSVDDESWTPFWEEMAPETWPWGSLRETLYDLTRSLRQDSLGETEWILRDPLRGFEEEGRRRVHHASGERRLLVTVGRALRRLASMPETAHERARLERHLLEYLRTRNAFHGLMVHDQGSLGLIRFQESFKRRGLGKRTPLRPSARKRRYQRTLLQLERARMAAALDSQLIEPFDRIEPGSPDPPLRRIEMRLTVPSGTLALRTLRAWIEGIADHLRPEPDGPALQSRVGLVFHLHKSAPGEKGATKALEEARRLLHFLRGHPGLRPLVVGFDAAGRERAAPPRTFLDAYGVIRDLVARHRSGAHRPPIRLGFTYHVGEDFSDLLTGLRHIDEVATLLLPKEEGGRLGHALALADDPRSFYERRGRQTEPTVGCHLLDLVWAWGRLAGSEHAPLASRLERRIAELLGETRLRSGAIARCYQAMGLDPPHSGKPASEKALLSHLRLRDEAAGKAVVVTADGGWLSLLEILQDLLKARLARRRICIEANPTANLIIGGFNDYREIPYRSFVDAGLPVSINTDDPGMFMTTLPGELGAVYGALADEWLHRQVLVWLRDRCFDAESSTFLGPGAPTWGKGLWTDEKLDRILRYDPD